ncbi:MAG: flavodoxin domain-containing protein [Chloroflexi bacterium]|nr:flavodoxin domain-containing protein [Chloroflexota bacterium]
MDERKIRALKGQSKETDMDELRVLIAYSSVHGSTAEIARAVALTLCRTGFDVDVVPVAEVLDVSDYDSVVLGSAVYGGKWRKDALEFLERFAPVLSHRDIWLFQSGPLGRSAQYIVRALPANVALMAEYLHVKNCATFGGRLDGSVGGPVARFLARAGFAGDYRDFGEIRVWAEQMARETAMNVVVGRTNHSASGRTEVVTRK